VDDVHDPFARGGENMIATRRWSPFAELDSMERRMRRLFEEVGFAPTLVPAADIYETDDEFVVQLDVPGYDEKELGIEVSDHVLTVKGERKEATEKDEKAFRLHERLEREFERRFALPFEADTKHVQAKFGKGVLELHTPKLAISKPQKVEIVKA
jgi:HSP20 family protein